MKNGAPVLLAGSGWGVAKRRSDELDLVSKMALGADGVNEEEGERRSRARTGGGRRARRGLEEDGNGAHGGA